MRIVRYAAALAAAFTLTVATGGTVLGATAAECQAQLSALRADTVAAQADFTNPGDATNAIAKLDAAAAKLSAGKPGDAVSKLVDFRSQLGTLASAPKPKLTADTAESLTSQALQVESCIQSIGT